MKILTIVGARPQFIKAAAVSRIMRAQHNEILLHTGQHYEFNMSEIFFRELLIPVPDYNLGISGGSHGVMTGKMLMEIETVMLSERPDAVLVYGDTNSTLAGALASVKLHIPVCHVEAGVRLGTLTNPEEVNRIVTDNVSSLLLCCTQGAVDSLQQKENKRNVFLVGDPMYDAFCYYSSKAEAANLIGLDGEFIKTPLEFYYLTCHREENTGNDELHEIMLAMNQLDAPCIYPVHPRNQERVKRICNLYNFKNIFLCRPVGYLNSIYLITHAKKIVTDSGGLQREAYFAKKQCVTVFDYATWPETMIGGCNQLSKPDSNEILSKLSAKINFEAFEPFVFGDGHSAEKIVKYLSEYMENQ